MRYGDCILVILLSLRHFGNTLYMWNARPVKHFYNTLYMLHAHPVTMLGTQCITDRLFPLASLEHPLYVMILNPLQFNFKCVPFFQFYSKFRLSRCWNNLVLDLFSLLFPPTPLRHARTRNQSIRGHPLQYRHGLWLSNYCHVRGDRGGRSVVNN